MFIGYVSHVRSMDVDNVKGIRGLCVRIRICWSPRNIMLILIGSKNKINRKEDRKNGKNGFVTFVGKT